jgi:preprotein translocase subunit SecG
MNMTGLPLLAAVPFIMKVVAVLFVICCVVLILVILVQKGRGGGLSAAFGGGMASGILGSKTGDFLTWVTIFLVGTFLLLGVVMAKFYRDTVSEEHDVGQPVRQEQPTDVGQVAPVEDVGSAASDANSAGEANLPGG